MAPLSVPLASRLPSSLRIDPTSPTVTRILGRLSRPSLVSLVLDWLDEGNQTLTRPYLRRRRPEEEEEDDNDDEEDEEDDDFYPPARSLEALQAHYSDLQARKGSKREVLDRVLEGDWRHGLSLYQLAMADLQHLYDHPTSQKWTAFRVVPLQPRAGGDDEEAAVSAVVDKTSLAVPRFHPSTFLRNLQAQLLPDIKVHYNFDRHKHLPLLLLRIFILDSPYSTALALGAGRSGSGSSSSSGSPATVESARTIYVAFPDASPFVYLSSAQTIEASTPSGAGTGATTATAPPATPRDARSLRSLVVEAIPKALSRPGARCALRPTNLATRNLAELLHRRGAGRTNTAGGGWALYADEKTIESPLSTVLPTPPPEEGDKEDESSRKRKVPELSHDNDDDARRARQRRRVAAARFGPSARMGDGLGVERVDIVMQDPFPGNLAEADVDGPGDEAAAAAAADADADAETAQPDRRRSRGGRRSQIDRALAHEAEEEEEEEAAEMEAEVKRRKEQAGTDADADAADPDPGPDPTWCPRVALTFQGPHVFAGIRQLVEAGVIDGKAMPGWMTGEEGVTVGAVRHGRIRGHKGSGML